MKPRSLFPLVLVGALSFGAGLGVMKWRQHAVGTPAHIEPGGPSPPRGQASAEDARVGADSRVSPKEFSRLLRGVSSVKEGSHLTSLIAGMALDDVQGLAQEMSQVTLGADPSQWMSLIAVFERWAELDPENLYAAMLNGELSEQQGHFAASLSLRAMTRIDPEKAWQRASEGGPYAMSGKQAVLNALGETDPARALALAHEDAGTRRHSWSVDSIMQNWFRRDPGAALQAIDGLPHGDFRAQAVRQLATAYATSDPEAALAWSQGLQNPAEKRQALSQVLSSLAAKDPQRVLALVEQPEFAATRAQAVAAAVKAWARQDFDGALTYALNSTRPNDQQAMLREISQNATAAQQQRLLGMVDQLPPSVAKAVYQSVIGNNGLNSASRPLEIIDNIKSPGLREEVLQQALNNSWSLGADVARELFSRLQSQKPHHVSNLANQLGRSDPQGAIAWAESLETPDHRKLALASALSSWAHNDPAAAARHLAAMTDPEQRQDLARNVAGAWAHLDEKAAVAWAESLGGSERATALGSIVQRLAGEDPAQAQALYTRFAAGLDAESADSQQNKQVARTLASSLTETDPQQAIAWAQGLGQGPAQQEAWSGIAEKWAGYDAHATSQWLVTLPAGEGRDMAADRLVTAIVRDDPESAWAWALTIGDQRLRREAAGRAIDAWRSFGDHDAALRALGNSGLDEAAINDFSQRLQKR